jgi:hypothetical protein
VSITNVLTSVDLLVDFDLLLTASGEIVFELDDFDLELELAGTGSPSVGTWCESTPEFSTKAFVTRPYL